MSDAIKCNCSQEAESWCIECSEFICNDCVQAHKRIKTTKNHQIDELIEQLHQKNDIIICNCSLEAAFWCADCLEFICIKCAEAHTRIKTTKNHVISSIQLLITKNDSLGHENVGGTKVSCCETITDGEVEALEVTADDNENYDSDVSPTISSFKVAKSTLSKDSNGVVVGFNKPADVPKLDDIPKTPTAIVQKNFADCTTRITATATEAFGNLKLICENQEKYLQCWDQLKDDLATKCQQNGRLPAVYVGTVKSLCGSDKGNTTISNLRKAAEKMTEEDQNNCPEETGIHWLDNCKSSLETMISENLCERHNAIDKCIGKITCVNFEFGAKPYRCNECNKSFSQKSNFSQHLYTNPHREKPYRCNVCHTSFRHKASLSAHLQIHTGEKQLQRDVNEKQLFSCDYCGQKVLKKTTLESHILMCYKNHSS